MKLLAVSIEYFSEASSDWLRHFLNSLPGCILFVCEMCYDSGRAELKFPLYLYRIFYQAN